MGVRGAVDSADGNALEQRDCIHSSVCYFDDTLGSCEPNDAKEGSPLNHQTTGRKVVNHTATASVNGTNATVATTNATVTANSTNTTR